MQEEKGYIKERVDSVEISVNSKDQITFGLKVYRDDIDQAINDAWKAFDDCVKERKKRQASI